MSVDTKYGEAIFKQTQEVAEMFKAAMPKITTNKNGYEIRTKVLEMAQGNVWNDYHAKFGGWEQSVSILVAGWVSKRFGVRFQTRICAE